MCKDMIRERQCSEQEDALAQQTENHQREQTVISKTTEAEIVDACQSVSEVA